MTKKAQPTLFDAKPLTKPARAPGHIITAVSENCGIPIKQVRKMPANQVFAIFYRWRDGGKAQTPERRRELAIDCANRLREAVGNPEFHSRELSDLVCEAVQFLDRDLLARVVGGIANLIDPSQAA